jgi:hypothetical protein
MSLNRKSEDLPNCGEGPFNIRDVMNTNFYEVVMYAQEHEDWVKVSEPMPKGAAGTLALTLNRELHERNSVDYDALCAAADPLDRM